jgi:multidrug efflux pump subunit AcrA (membrane-fusion protein)
VLKVIGVDDMELIPSSISDYTLESYLIKTSTRSRIIYWIIIGTIIGGIAVLPFIYVDVSVQARGYFQSDVEKQVVYTPFQGKVIYASVRNGDRVTKGDTLLVIDSESIRAQQAALKQRITENDASISDLQILTGIDIADLQHVYTGLVTKRYQAEFENLRNQYAIQLQKYRKKKA